MPLFEHAGSRDYNLGCMKITDGPLEQKVELWERVVETIAREYDGLREEDANDLAVRSGLESQSHLLAPPEYEPLRLRIEAADRKFTTATRLRPTWWVNCLKPYWTEKEWWYSREPLNPGPNWGED